MKGKAKITKKNLVLSSENDSYEDTKFIPRSKIFNAKKQEQNHPEKKKKNLAENL